MLLSNKQDPMMQNRKRMWDGRQLQNTGTDCRKRALEFSSFGSFAFLIAAALAALSLAFTPTGFAQTPRGKDLARLTEAKATQLALADSKIARWLDRRGDGVSDET